MKNIINLVKLQYSSMYSIKKYLFTIVAISLIMTIVNNNFIIVACGILTMALTYSTTFYEDKSKIGYLIYSLPVKAKDFILAKYIYGYLNTILIMIFSSMLFLLLNKFNIGIFKELTLGSLLVATFFVGFIIIVLVLPFVLILGFEKGRLIIVFLAVMPVCFSQSLIQYLKPISFDPTIVLTSIILLVFVFTLISYVITSKLYSRKDIN